MEAKYNKIGTGYNRTRQADPYLTQQLLAHLAPQKAGRYLDIGCGTGNYTHEFQQKGVQFVGIDPSEKMLAKAKSRNQQIDWQIGSAEATGLPSASVDGITASLTLHHWTDLGKSFSELHRVIKPNGRMVIFTSTPEQMKGYWLNHYFPKMLMDSMVQMPSFDQIEKTMTQAGFQIINTEPYFIQPDLQDKFLYCGKQKPEAYFEPQIRQGISSFSSLANQQEVKEGLAALRKDIDSGEVKSVIEHYENKLGDYLYVIGEAL